MEEFVKGNVVVIPFTGLPSIKFHYILIYLAQCIFLAKEGKHFPLSIGRGARNPWNTYAFGRGEVNVSLLDQSL